MPSSCDTGGCCCTRGSPRWRSGSRRENFHPMTSGGGSNNWRRRVRRDPQCPLAGAVLLPPSDDAAVYVEFAAVYVELRHFAPGLLPVYFPAIASPETAGRVLRGRRCRTAILGRASGRAPQPQDLMPPAQQELPPPGSDGTSGTAAERWSAAEGPAGAATDRLYVPAGRRPSERKSRQWSQRAERAATAGNLAGAAIRRAHAAAWAPAKARPAVAAALREDIRRLVARLLAALAAPAEDPRPCAKRSWPWPTRRPAACGPSRPGCFTTCRRCVPITSAACTRWTWSAGRGRSGGGRSSGRCPASGKCSCPSTSAVPPAAWPPPASGSPAAGSLRICCARPAERVEEHLRDQFRPRVTRTLDDVGLRPQNLP